MCLYNFNREDVETRLDIDQAIDSLSLDVLSQTIINLMKQQYSYLEISRALKISHDVVNARQRKVCERLSELLPEYSDSIIFDKVSDIFNRELSETEREFITLTLIRCRSRKRSKLTSIFIS